MVKGVDDSNGWNEWSRHVLAELKRLNDCYTSLDEKYTQLLVEITTLKVKSGMWGFAGSAAALFLAWALKKI
jgi:hypothetical protein